MSEIHNICTDSLIQVVVIALVPVAKIKVWSVDEIQFWQKSFEHSRKLHK